VAICSSTPLSSLCNPFGWCEQIFLAKHASDSKEKWVSGNLLFFRMHRLSDIYFVGGFGTVQWVDVKEYATVKPDTIVMQQPHRTLEVRLIDSFQELRDDEHMV
jgi:hypothetical protein